MIRSFLKQYSFWIITPLLVIQFLLLQNLQFTAWPEMLAYPYLRNHGFLLYKDMIHPYPPLLTLMLSWVYSVFGYQVSVVQSVAWAIVLTTTLLVFVLTKQIARAWIAASVTLVYVLVQPLLEGNMLWFDMATAPFLLMGFFFSIRWFQHRSYEFLFAGLAFASAAFVKQTAGIIYISVLLYLLVRRVPQKFIVQFLVGPLVLGIPFLVRLMQENALADFLNWTIIYPLTQWKNFPGYINIDISVRDALFLIVLFVPIFFTFATGKKRNTIVFVLIVLVLLGTLVMVYPRFSYFHLQPALAVAMVGFGYSMSMVKGVPRFIVSSFLAFIVFTAFWVRHPFLAHEWGKEPRFYGVEDRHLAQLIANATPQEESVFLLGLHPGLYVTSERIPPKRWADNFGWYLEISGVQEEIITRFINNPPEAIIWRTPNPGNWYDLGSYQPQKIVEWLRMRYTQKEEITRGVWLWTRN